MTPSSKSQVSADAGFTLLELIVVLAILVLAATVALPLAGRTQRSLAVRTSAIDLASALKSVRAEAVRSNTEQTVVIDLSRRQFTGGDLGRAHVLPREVTVAYEIPANEQIAEGLASIRFNPDGSSSGGKVTMTGQKQTASVTVDWLTGRTEVRWGH